MHNRNNHNKIVKYAAYIPICFLKTQRQSTPEMKQGIVIQDLHYKRVLTEEKVCILILVSLTRANELVADL